MNRRLGFLLFLFLLSALAGYLLSKASLVGRVGISLFYQQYSFLKVWWQGGLLVLAVWLLLAAFQDWAHRRLPAQTARLLSLALIFVFLAGLYFTYRDFRHSTAHRWLGERFHLGGYLFWVGCILGSVFYLTQGRNIVSPTVEESSINQTPVV